RQPSVKWPTLDVSAHRTSVSSNSRDRLRASSRRGRSGPTPFFGAAAERELARRGSRSVNGDLTARPVAEAASSARSAIGWPRKSWLSKVSTFRQSRDSDQVDERVGGEDGRRNTARRWGLSTS